MAFCFYSLLKKLLFVFLAASITFLLISGRRLFRYFQLGNKIRGPSLWELATVHARDAMGKELLSLISKLTAKYDYKPWKLWRGTQLLVFISDPDTIGEAFKSKHLLNKDEILYGGLQSLVGKNSITLSGPEWKLRRNLISPAFNKTLLEGNLYVMCVEADRCARKLQNVADGTDFDVHRYIETAILRTAIRSLGLAEYELDDKLAEEIGWAFNAGAKAIQMQFQNPIHYYLVCKLLDRSWRNKLNEIVDRFTKLFQEERDHMMERRGKEWEPETTLQFLYQGMLKKDCLSGSETASEMISLLLAATETTSSALCAAIFLLALNPHIQRRAVEEIESVFSNSDRPVVPEDLSRLEYLERVIKEAMRLFPPGGILGRRADEDINLNGTIIPKGATVLFNVMGLHRDPRNFKDPMKFDPDRFSPESQDKTHPYAYLPFSSGMRNCVGRLHAMIVMKIHLSTLLRHYKILPGRGMKTIEDIKTEMSFTMHTGGSLVRFVPVDQS